MSKKSAPKALTPLPIPCACNCKTCVQKLERGDIVQERAHGPIHLIAGHAYCNAITNKATVISCPTFRASAKKIGHVSNIEVTPEAKKLLKEYRIH